MRSIDVFWGLGAALVLGSVVLVASPTSRATASPAPRVVQKAKKKLLVVTHTTGFRHSSIGTAEKVLKELGEKSGVFEVDYCRNGDDVKKMLTKEGLKPYDAVFFANTTGNLGIPDLKEFVAWVKEGHGFLGAHSAGDTYHPQDAMGDTSYIDLVSCEFQTHGKQCEIEALVEDKKHPAVEHLGDSWKITDEIYIFKENKRADVHTLLAVDKHPNDGAKNANEPGDYLIAWCKPYGKGKVFYTALGHREDVWENPVYQKHLLGGIEWATGLKRGGSKIGTKRP